MFVIFASSMRRKMALLSVDVVVTRDDLDNAPLKETRGINSFEVDFRYVEMIVAEGFSSEIHFGVDNTLGPFGEDWGDGLQPCD
jgi:hypothetical protein